MTFQMYPIQPNKKVKCARCHEDIKVDRMTLFVGDQPYHYDCWITSIRGPRAHKVVTGSDGEEKQAA